MNGMFSFLLQNVMTTGMLFNELAIMMCSNTNLTLCNYVVTTRGYLVQYVREMLES